MNRRAVSVVLAAVCACHRREDTSRAAASDANVVVASPAPSETAAASAAPIASDDAHVAPPLARRGVADSDDAGQGGSSRIATGREGRTPKIRQGAVTVSGRLPPEVVPRVVRRSFGRFRACYVAGLSGDPKLAGTVATRFVIDAQGNVTSAARDASTTLSDASVVSCIMRGFSSMSFPQPEGGGIVTVVYPLILEPGD